MNDKEKEKHTKTNKTIRAKIVKALKQYKYYGY